MPFIAPDAGLSFGNSREHQHIARGLPILVFPRRMKWRSMLKTTRKTRLRLTGVLVLRRRSALVLSSISHPLGSSVPFILLSCRRFFYPLILSPVLSCYPVPVAGRKYVSFETARIPETNEETDLFGSVDLAVLFDLPRRHTRPASHVYQRRGRLDHANSRDVLRPHHVRVGPGPAGELYLLADTFEGQLEDSDIYAVADVS